MKFRSVSAAVIIMCLSTNVQSQDICSSSGTVIIPLKRKLGNVEVVQPVPFPRYTDGSIRFASHLHINPDGAPGAYVPGDHGFVRVANGVDRWVNSNRVSCSSSTAISIQCRKDWLEAERLEFGAGTAEFRPFAMEVVRLDGTKKGPAIVGNGRGRPRLSSAPIETVTGQAVTPYVSTTSVRHTVGGQTQHLDSSRVPTLVVKTDRKDLYGSVAWLRYGDKETFAIVGDGGPAFGEAGLAVHEVLRGVPIANVGNQKVGPIPVNLRCTIVERIKPPFSSAPDQSKDQCRSEYTPASQSDIRALINITSGVKTIILPSVKMNMSESYVISKEVTFDYLKNIAESAGFTREKLLEMANCISSG